MAQEQAAAVFNRRVPPSTIKASISLWAISAECFPELLKIPPAEETFPTSPLGAAILMKENPLGSGSAAGLKVEVWRTGAREGPIRLKQHWSHGHAS